MLPQMQLQMNKYWIFKASIPYRSNHAAFGEFNKLAFIDSTREMPLNEIEMHVERICLPLFIRVV